MDFTFADLADDAVAEIVASCSSSEDLHSARAACKRAYDQTQVDVFWQRACEKRFVPNTILRLPAFCI
jgi:hypothetical protein